MSEPEIGRWWREDKDEVHRTLNQTIEHIRALMRARLVRDKKHLRLYCPDVAGNGQDVLALFKRDNPQFNMIKQAVDTQLAMVTGAKPKPQYIVTEGSFDMERVARLRTRCLEGQMYDLGVYDELGAACALLSLVLGTGHMVGSLDPETGKPVLRNALPGEVLIDPRGAASGNPLAKYVHAPQPRDLVKELYPDALSSRIDDARGPTDFDRDIMHQPRDRTGDEVMVTEAWFPAIGKQKGRHVVAVSTCTLLDEEWEWSIPVEPLRYQKRPMGYWGLGLAEIGAEVQADLDLLMERALLCRHLGSTAWLILDQRSDVRVEKLSNAPLTVVRVSGAGKDPDIKAFNATPTELHAEIDRIRERFLALTGISPMAAQAERPAGLNSAPAQRAYEDISSQRHQVIGREWERFHMGLVRMLEQLNAQAQKKDGGYSVAARTQRGLVPLIRTVKWSEAGMDHEKYRLTCFPTSQLPATVSGRLEALQEWVASGFVSRPYAQKQILDAPNDDYQQLELADLDFCMWQMEEILDGGTAEPEPYQNLQLAADTARRVYLQVKARGAPEDILQRLRVFVDAAMPPVAPAAPAAAPPPEAMPMAPGAALQLPALPGQAVPPEAMPV